MIQAIPADIKPVPTAHGLKRQHARATIPATKTIPVAENAKTDYTNAQTNHLMSVYTVFVPTVFGKPISFARTTIPAETTLAPARQRYAECA